MSIAVFYGIFDNHRNVTDICLNQLTINNIITIPNGDYNRANFFTDHLPGIEKKIFITMNNNGYEYDQTYIVKINLNDFTMNAQSVIEDVNRVNNKINIIHNTLKINHGHIREELPEQKMVVRYLTGNEKVLEIGANIGRNSLVIASIVNNDTFLTLECQPDIYKQLEENRKLNNFTFHTENSALSKRKLIQRGWDTKPSDVLEEGFAWVNTITLDELKLKYKIDFDTLVLDCEGAFYYILKDTPEILDNIKLIIMENDYHIMSHKEYVDSVLKSYGFYNDYKEAGGWGGCYNNFFEVWKKSGF
jgi:FkbM family methyltransferase